VSPVEPAGGIAAALWRDLHQADGIRRRFVLRIERALGAHDRKRDARIDRGTERAVARHAEIGEGVKVESKSARQRRLAEYQRGTLYFVARGKLAERHQRIGFVAAFGKIRSK